MHFCRQYDEWKDAIRDISLIQNQNFSRVGISENVSDPTGDAAVKIAFYKERMAMVERAARECDEAISIYILRAVTKGLSYDQIRAGSEIPCGKDYFYDRLRKFFYILDKIRM